MTITGVEDELLWRLEARAARNGRTMNDEILAILIAALNEESSAGSGA